jgi:hypothetical protein
LQIENLQTLKINKLSQEQYDKEKEAGNLDPTALYLTPTDTSDFDNLKAAVDAHLADTETNPHDVGLDDLAGINVNEDEVNSLRGAKSNIQD